MISNTKIISTCFLLSLIMSCTEDNKPSESEIKVKPIFTVYEDGRIANDGGATRGVAWGDFDQDGFPELYTANTSGQWNAVYKNNGGTLKKITEDKTTAESTIYGGTSRGKLGRL